MPITGQERYRLILLFIAILPFFFLLEYSSTHCAQIGSYADIHGTSAARRYVTQKLGENVPRSFVQSIKCIPLMFVLITEQIGVAEIISNGSIFLRDWGVRLFFGVKCFVWNYWKRNQSTFYYKAIYMYICINITNMSLSITFSLMHLGRPYASLTLQSICLHD